MSNNIAKLYVGEIPNCIMDAYACGTQNTPFFWGSPGIGKTQAIESVQKPMSDKYQCEFFVDSLITSQMESIDFFIPALQRTEDKIKSFMKVPNNTFVRDSAARGIIFFDELSNASPDVQKASQSIITDRKIGDTHLPEGVMIACAGNRKEDRAGSMGLLSALANRLEHYEVVATFEDWVEWATKAGKHHSVISYLYTNSGDLNLFKNDSLCNPTPRIWERVADYLEYYEQINAPDKSVRRRVQSLVGGAIADKFMTHIKCFEKFPTKDEIIKDPQKAKLPQEMDVRYALAIAIFNWCDKKNADKYFEYICRMNLDFQGMFFKLIHSYKVEMIGNSKVFMEWGVANRKLLTQR